MREAKDISVLIVDDEEDLRETIALDFERQGFRVQSAENVAKALAAVEAGIVDVIISDIRMPGATGVDLLKQVRAKVGGNYKEAPIVILMTGQTDLNLNEIYSSGADAVFAKPFDRRALIAEALRAVHSKDHPGKPYRADRIPTNLNIELRFPETQSTYHGKLVNIGDGGFFAAIIGNFPCISARTAFKIRYGQETAQFLINGEGVVRWVRTQDRTNHPSGCGVEFTDLSVSDKHRIIDLLNAVKTGVAK